MPDWLIWQVADSTFPAGGFAHSGGLEAAWQAGLLGDASGLAGLLRLPCGRRRTGRPRSLPPPVVTPAASMMRTQFATRCCRTMSPTAPAAHRDRHFSPRQAGCSLNRLFAEFATASRSPQPMQDRAAMSSLWACFRRYCRRSGSGGPGRVQPVPVLVVAVPYLCRRPAGNRRAIARAVGAVDPGI